MKPHKLQKAKSFSNQLEKMQTYTLTSLKVRLKKRFGRAMLEKIHIDMARPLLDNFTHNVAIEIETMIFGEKQPTEYTVSVLIPATWWHHLVDDRFPEWYKKRFPVKRKEVYRTVTFNHWALLPKFNKIPPGEEIQMFTEPYRDEPGVPTDES